MILHAEPGSFMYFGDALQAMHPHEYLTWTEGSLLDLDQFAFIGKRLSLKDVSFLHQTHSGSGFMVDKDHHIPPFSRDGDYLITNEKLHGIGVMTADCLPVICYDSRTQSIGIAHAGWRGAVDGVVIAMLDHMKQEYGIDPAGIKIFLGPSAKVCCYEVAAHFDKNLERYTFGDQMIRFHYGTYFFDLPGFVSQQLLSWGVPLSSIHTQYNSCTICTPSFCSYRRACNEGAADQSGRQMTIVCIK